ncbi:hypothetical protein HMPREF0185_03426 [Brevundimonas diminuta 470-4]|nr:hypothetical protein HMPREF0185_03426 [Brevundimonas diminuta 470-4]
MTIASRHDPWSWLKSPATALLAVLIFFIIDGAAAQALAHGVAEGDKGYIQETSGIVFWPFVYLGAKHMVTGYDHLLFLFGVIFFLYRLKDISIYVTMFAIGHSTTLLLGVLTNISVSSYLVDAIIGLSVVYKALDNLGASSAGSASSPTPRSPPWCSACSTASAWPPSCRTSSCPPTACWSISSPSTSAWRSASFWRSAPSSSSWVSGAAARAFSNTPISPTSSS